MSSKFQLKRTAVSGRTPNTTSSSNSSFIDTAELALNVADGKLFTSNGSSLIEIGSNVSSLSVSNTITTPSVSVNYIDFANTGDPPAKVEGRVFYDNAQKALAIYNEEADITLQIGQEHWRRVYNNTANTILNGSAVYITGAQGEHPTVALTDASDYAKVHVLGIATHDIETGTYGYITTKGTVNDLDLTGFLAGQDVYIDFVTPGGFTAIAPTYPNYAYQVGTIIANTNPGNILIHPSAQAFDAIRVVGDARVAGDLTVEGNFIVAGNVSSTSVTNLAIDDNFVYVASGDTISTTTFSGSGLNDATLRGVFEGGVETTYYVRIDSTGTTDTFEWSKDNFVTTEATGVAITGVPQLLDNNISIDFEATTGHTLNDVWSGTAVLVNIDVGIVGNYNDGTYQHTGVFRDATDNRWKFFDNYTPEPSANVNIDTSHASFTLATVEANAFYGTLVGTANNASHLNGQTAAFYVSNTYANSTFAKLAGATFR